MTFRAGSKVICIVYAGREPGNKGPYIESKINMKYVKTIPSALNKSQQKYKAITEKNRVTLALAWLSQLQSTLFFETETTVEGLKQSKVVYSEL